MSIEQQFSEYVPRNNDYTSKNHMICLLFFIKTLCRTLHFGNIIIKICIYYIIISRRAV